MKTPSTVLAMIPFLVGCGYHSDDAAIRAKVVGTWMATEPTSSDRAQVSNAVTTFEANCGLIYQCTVTHSDNKPVGYVAGGTWQIENGLLIAQQTNVHGATLIGERTTNKIVQLNSREMILSNSFGPRNVLVRKQ